MSDIRHRIRLATALKAFAGKRVTDIGHSIGSTFNLGGGRTVAVRYDLPRRGRRRPGYHPRAELDLFFMCSFWTLRSGSGYRLEDRSPARRIAREVERLKGLTVASARLVGYRDGMEMRLSGGMVLTTLASWDDRDPGWNLRVTRVRREFLRLNGHEAYGR